MNTPFDDIFASAEREQAIAAAAAAPKLPLWEHQAECIAQIDEALAAGINRIVVKIPTGGGKTRLASEFILQKRYLEFGARVGFWMPRLDLVKQTIAAFRQAGIANVGVIQGLHRLTDPTAPVQICSEQTLTRRIIPQFDLIFIDECHLQFKKILAWIDDPKLQSTPVIGLSATPWSKGLGKHYHRLINPTSIKDLIEKKILCPFVVYAPPGPDLSHARTLAGDYHEGDLSEACAAQIRYSPELQPAETLWALVDEPIVNKHIATIKELEEKIASQCVALADRLPLVATADRSELITRKPYE